jgi:hypothetical protein
MPALFVVVRRQQVLLRFVSALADRGCSSASFAAQLIRLASTVQGRVNALSMAVISSGSTSKSCPWRIRKSSQKRGQSCEMSTSCYRSCR